MPPLHGLLYAGSQRHLLKPVPGLAQQHEPKPQPLPLPW